MVRREYKDSLNDYEETRSSDILRAATRIIAHKDRYKEIEKETNIPWDFIGVIHLRESNLDFNTHLHNGDSLQARTRRVPKGHPKEGEPPFTWEESAIDALKLKKFDQETSWTMEEICERLEKYNGLGYKYKKKPSPYLWAGTDQYEKGKYVADGKYDPNAVDKQLGTIPVLMKIRELNAKIPTKEIVKSSRKLTLLQRLRNAVVGLVSSVMAADWLGMLGQVKQFATDNIGVIVLVGAASIWGVFKLIEQFSIQDYKEGRYMPSKKEGE